MRMGFLKIVLSCLAFSTAASHAAMVLNSSRVIIQNGKNETSFGIRNLDQSQAFLAQSWLTPQEGDGEVAHVSLTPQLVQVNGGAEQLVRILYEGVGLPQDRESMFWLNVQEIPQRADSGNAVQIAVLQRIKVFYRPKGIQGDAMAANAGIEWRLDNGALQVGNPSAFHVSIINIATGADSIQEVLVLKPGETRRLDLNGAKQAALHHNENRIRYAIVNDYGGHDKYQLVLNGAAPVKGRSQ